MTQETLSVTPRSLAVNLEAALGWNKPKPEWLALLPQIGLQNLPSETVLTDYLYEHELNLIDTMVEKGLSEYTSTALVEYLKKTSEGRIIGTYRSLMEDGGPLTLGELRGLDVDQLRFIEGITVGYKADAVKALIG